MDPNQGRPPGMPGLPGMFAYGGIPQQQVPQQPQYLQGGVPANFGYPMGSMGQMPQPQQQMGQANMKQLLFAAAAAAQQQGSNPQQQQLPMPSPSAFAQVPQQMQPQMQIAQPQQMPSSPAPQQPQQTLGGARTTTPADPSSSFLLSATVSLVQHLDKRLVVVLRDGRKFVGVLRSFDQFANIVLQKTVERIWVGNKYAEKPLGVFLIRGENVVLVGEVDEEKEIALTSGAQPRWTKVDLATIQELDKQDREVRVEQLKMRRKLLLSRGLTSIGQSTGYSLFGGFGIDVFQDDTTI